VILGFAAVVTARWDLGVGRRGICACQQSLPLCRLAYTYCAILCLFFDYFENFGEFLELWKF
jgi:hypothetical protein